MKFKASYLAQTPEAKNTLVASYWRTVWADDVNAATKTAKQYTRKGYILGTVTQDEGSD